MNEEELKEVIHSETDVPAPDEVAEVAAEEQEELAERVKTLSPGQLVLKRFFRSKLSVIGLSIIVFLFLVCFIGPLFSPNMDYKTIDYDGPDIVTSNPITYVEGGETYTMYDIEYTPSINIKAPPSAKHWFGTDLMAQDVFMRLLYGGRISLTIGFMVVILETLIGVIIGGIAGYFGGIVDMIIMRIIDVFYCIPQMPILFICSALLDAYQVGGFTRIYWLLLVLVVFGWAGTARMVRGQILSLREQEFMLAAKSMGIPAHRKIFLHLVPNVMPQLIVSMTLGLGSVILTESTLSFLNLGVQMPQATWGNMLSCLTSDSTVIQNNFWMWGPAGICIMLAVLSFNFIGDGLRDAFDPKMKK